MKQPFTTQNHSVARKGLVLALLACVAVTGRAQTGTVAPFENPPLRYRGPDPTADYFLPTVAGPDGLEPTPLPPVGFPPAEARADPDRQGGPQPVTATLGETPAAEPVAAPRLPRSPAPEAVSARQLPAPATAPNATNSRFSTPDSLLHEPFQHGAAPVEAESVLPYEFGATPGESTFVFPANAIPPSGIATWPDENLTNDPLGSHDGGLTEHKDGFFQSLALTGTWIDRNSQPSDYGITEVDLKATFAVPLPKREWPLLLGPTFYTRFLSGPDGVDLPPRLYEAYFDFTWVPRFNSRWTAIVGVAPGVFSDFQESTDAFRITGKGLVRYDWIPGKLELIAGMLYLGRQDALTLPAGGLIWKPDHCQKYELIFPRPKLARLIRRGARHEDWVYVGAEFGGNSYAVELAPATPDIITLRDYRAYLGIERKFNGGAGIRLEAGYVWGRVIEFASGLPDLTAEDTAMIRGGVIF